MTESPSRMLRALNKRRLQLGTTVLVLVMLTGLLVARLPLAGFAVSSLLRLAGASEISFTVVQASPWRVELENLAFRIRTQAFAARRASLVRTHWWTPSLGAVRVEQARIPLNIDGSDTDPWAWSTYKNGTAAIRPAQWPVELFALEGQVIIQAAALTDQAVAVKIQTQQAADKTWEGSVQADGPGLRMRAEGGFDPAKNALAFKLQELTLELQPWQDFIQRLVLLPGGTLELAGRFSASGAGNYTGRTLTAAGTGRLRDGRVQNELRGVSAEGIDIDLTLVDFGKSLAKPGTLRVRELRTGSLVLSDLEAGFALEDATQIAVARATFQALGGRVTAEPFKYFLDLRELEAVLLVEDVHVEDVMALTQNLPAKASGRVSGRLPVQVDGSGLRLGTGWLALKPGAAAELQLSADGLLTAGKGANSPDYAVLKRIETGLLKMKIGEMRLEVRPLNASPGCSARLHLQGEPVDRAEGNVPVTLDLKINGSLERFLNLGPAPRTGPGVKL